VIGESSWNANNSQYFKCQGYGHATTQCPSRNLLVRKVDDDEIETVVYEPLVARLIMMMMMLGFLTSNWVLLGTHNS